jgi:hypothetical protein
MNVRTTFVALAALGLFGAAQSAFAQDAAPAAEEAQATLTAQVTPATVIPEVTPAATVPVAAQPVVSQAVAEQQAPRCRWQRAQRQGIEFVLVPLDLAREALSALRRGTTASC